MMDDPPASRLRILIVEDDRVTARDLEGTLQRRGFIVAGVAHSASEALELAQRSEPGIALVDVHLDNADEGIEIGRTLRETRGIPVVFVTGFSEDALFEQAREARPAGFVRKPFSEAELAARLEAVEERSRAQEDLADRIPGLEAVASEVSQAVIASDLDGAILFLNSAAEALTAWSADDARGAPLAKVAPLADPPQESNEGETPASPGSRRAVLTTRTGEKRFVEERSAPIKSGDGEAIGLVTVLAESGGAGKPEAPADAGPPETLHPSSTAEEPAPTPPARAGALKQIAELSRDPAFRQLIKHPSPSDAGGEGAAEPPPSRTVETAEPVFSAAGSPLVDDVGDPLIKIDEDGVVRYANAEAASVFGEDQGLVGQPFWNRFAEGECERYEDAFHRPLSDGRRHRFEFHDSTRGRWFEVRVYPSGDGVLALFTDITSTKLEAAESVRQQRLEGLGLLARGFAHDFNNHLTTITGNVSLARERQPDDAELQQMLSEAQTAASRATGLVQQLMTFARGGRPVRRRTRISDLVRRILTEQRLRHPDIRYQFQGSEDELVANVDPAQVGRLVENLVTNATAAMSEGGVLIVRCGRIAPEEVLRIRESHTPADEDHLLVEVIDTGHGMNEDALSQVFEPYFTTRKENNATGIGLTVCESIARAHGGFVQLQSKEGKGTIASFCAPLGRHPDNREQEPLKPAAYPNFDIPNLKESPHPPGESEPLLVGTRILVLEDDAPIRRLMAATLRRAGHEVVETKEGRETVEVYREALERGDKFHLLICDLTIENGQGGVETMRQLLEMDPEILAIVSSGYSDAPAMSSPASFGFKGVLPKPYAPSELRAAVHRILAAHHIIS